VDTALMRVNDALMSFPALVLAIAIVGLLGPSLRNAMIAIGIVYAPRIARVVRGATMAVKEETYIEAARAVGCTRMRIVRRHVLPNILSPLVVQTTLSMGLAILAEAALSFLGLGVQPPQASLGSILGRTFTYIHQAPYNVLSPGLLILVIVLAFNVVGDGLRDAFGRERRKGA
jgi:peptide/nickel transport system permease protein